MGPLIDDSLLSINKGKKKIPWQVGHFSIRFIDRNRDRQYPLHDIHKYLLLFNFSFRNSDI